MKKLSLLMITLILAFISLFVFITPTYAYAEYDSWEDLNGKQYYLTADTNLNSFIAVPSAIDSIKEVYKGYCDYGSIDVYDSSDNLIGSVEGIIYSLYTDSNYQLFHFAFHSEAQMNHLSVTDSKGELHDFFEPSYIVWEIPEGAYSWDKAMLSEPDVHCGSSDWNDIFGDVSLCSSYLNIDEEYMYDKGFKDGQKHGYDIGYLDGVRDSASENEDVEDEFNLFEEKNTKVLIGLASLVLLSSGVLFVLTKIKKKKR